MGNPRRQGESHHSFLTCALTCIDMHKCVYSNAADVTDLQVCGHEAERGMETSLTSTHLYQTGQDIHHQLQRHRGPLSHREKETHVPSIYGPVICQKQRPSRCQQREDAEKLVPTCDLGLTNLVSPLWEAGQATPQLCTTAGVAGKEGADEQIHSK